MNLLQAIWVVTILFQFNASRLLSCCEIKTRSTTYVSIQHQHDPYIHS